TAFRAGDRVGVHRAMHAMMLQRPDLTDRLARIAAPTLLVVGTEDATWSPARAEKAVTELADGRVAVVEGAGHIPPLERPAETAAAILDLWQAS
uniref:alpha/beta fold hydrolase n=1 Tax=Pseudonocardia pini TaxID=2758030 RepID=UPI0015F03208